MTWRGTVTALLLGASVVCVPLGRVSASPTDNTWTDNAWEADNAWAVTDNAWNQVDDVQIVEELINEEMLGLVAPATPDNQAGDDRYRYHPCGCSHDTHHVFSHADCIHCAVCQAFQLHDDEWLWYWDQWGIDIGEVIDCRYPDRPDQPERDYSDEWRWWHGDGVVEPDQGELEEGGEYLMMLFYEPWDLIWLL